MAVGVVSSRVFLLSTVLRLTRGEIVFLMPVVAPAPSPLPPSPSPANRLSSSSSSEREASKLSILLRRTPFLSSPSAGSVCDCESGKRRLSKSGRGMLNTDDDSLPCCARVLFAAAGCGESSKPEGDNESWRCWRLLLSSSATLDSLDVVLVAATAVVVAALVCLAGVLVEERQSSVLPAASREWLSSSNSVVSSTLFLNSASSCFFFSSCSCSCSFSSRSLSLQ
mmetsp:Transcript_5066/g.15463  ORF Transcript_5066/g.15463 Transcript_5066/m.15463 type:complete len:225 (-) Transcript_5066:1652-2326(-)